MAEIVGSIDLKVLKERQERARTAKPEVLSRIRAFGAARREQARKRKEPAKFTNRPHLSAGRG